MEGENWVRKEGKYSRKIEKCCPQNELTITGYPKIGESRLFLPLNRWLCQFWERITKLAQSEAAVYKGRLRTYDIKEINLLEVAAENPRERVRLNMNPGAKYFLKIRSFRVRGNELFAEFTLDQAFSVHTSVYLFPDKIRLEYNTLAIGEWNQKIRNGEALINYLESLGDRRFHLSFSLSELVLEELGYMKKLWVSSEGGLWIDDKSLSLITMLQHKTGDEEEIIRQTAQQVGALEQSLMDERQPTLKSSDLDDGKSLKEIEKEKEAKAETRPLEPVLSSTRVGDQTGDQEDPSIKSESEVKRELLKSLHVNKKPIVAAEGEEVKNMFAQIAAVSDKFRDKNKDDPKVLQDLVVTVEALTEVLKQNANMRYSVGGEDNSQVFSTPKKTKVQTLDGLAENLQALLKGKDVRAERTKKKEENEATDWKSRLGSDGIVNVGELFVTPIKPSKDHQPTSNWGGSDQW